MKNNKHFMQIDCLSIEAIVNPRDICFLSGIIEGYDDMAVLRTLDSSQGLVQILASPCYKEEMYELLHSLKTEMHLEIKDGRLNNSPFLIDNQAEL